MTISAKTTIDNLPANAHIRFAKGQQRLDSTLVSDAATIHPHAAVTSASALYVSQFTQLFKLDKCNLPWAAFTPPPRLASANKRTFSPRWLLTSPGTKKSPLPLQQDDTLPPLDGESLEETRSRDPSPREILLSASDLMYYHSQPKRRERQESENTEEVFLPTPFRHLKSKVDRFPKLLHQTPARFEKEKMAMHHLVERLEWIDMLLKHINAATARFQRG